MDEFPLLRNIINCSDRTKWESAAGVVLDIFRVAADDQHQPTWVDDHDPREVFRILAEIECDYHVLLLESGAIHCLRTDRVKPINAKSLKSMMRCAGRQPNPVIG